MSIADDGNRSEKSCSALAIEKTTIKTCQQSNFIASGNRTEISKFRPGRSAAALLNSDSQNVFLWSLVVLLIALASATDAIAQAQQPAGKFVDRAFRDDSGEHKYVVFVPARYRADQS